ncbi:unnamed protein product, partial [Heterosigma akashiwo]
FLNSDIDGDVYVKQPPGFVDKDHPHKVWKLKKALYGLRQSPRLWYNTLHEFLLQQNFVRSDYDSNIPTVVSSLKSSFVSRFSITDLGPLTSILGIKLQRYQNNPEPKHFEAAQRAFRYLKGTQSERLRLGGDLLQTAVTTSTVEAEYLALRAGLKDIMWLRHLLVDLSCPQVEPTPVIEDNSACIEWARDMVVSRKTRHFHVSYHLAKEQVELGTIQMHYAKTSDQLADIFTKAL